MATKLTIAIIAGATMLMVLGAGAASAFPTPGTTYTGSGTEPFWNVRIGGGRMVYDTYDGEDIRVATPRPTPIRLGRRYATSRLTIEITREGRCNDGMSDHYYQETVRVWLGRRTGRALEGCGGVRVPWPELSGSRWHIVSIAGQAVSGDTYFLDFDQGRLTAQAGCNRLSGTYTERRPTLGFGPIASTRMACPGPRMAHEQRVLDILSVPLSMNFLGAESLVLGNRNGQIRLRQDN